MIQALSIKIANFTANRITTKHITLGILFLKVLLVGIVVVKFLPTADPGDLKISSTFFWFVLAGFIAQVVDGALGMAYGITSNAVLLGFGLSPKLASAAVHSAEVFTTGVSGLSHIKFGNFDKSLFFKLVIPGVLSASLGAFLLGAVLDGDFVKPLVSVYLVVLGIVILRKSFRKQLEIKRNVKRAPLLAAFGGFFDAIGGGGWGPIVTSNLISQGNAPDKVIGTVNTAEFFVTYFTAGILIYFTGIQSWQIILGLIVGGAIAAPFGAYITKRVPQRVLFVAVGILIVVISLFSLWNSFA